MSSINTFERSEIPIPSGVLFPLGPSGGTRASFPSAPAMPPPGALFDDSERTLDDVDRLIAILEQVRTAAYERKGTEMAAFVEEMERSVGDAGGLVRFAGPDLRGMLLAYELLRTRVMAGKMEKTEKKG